VFQTALSPEAIAASEVTFWALLFFGSAEADLPATADEDVPPVTWTAGKSAACKACLNVTDASWSGEQVNQQVSRQVSLNPAASGTYIG
jgi:hypothetical protein